MNEQSQQMEEVRYSISKVDIEEIYKIARELKRPECPYSNNQQDMMKYVISSSTAHGERLVEILEEYNL